MLCNALVISRLQYCDSLLLSVDKNLLNNMQRVMNLAARIVSRSSRNEHISPILEALGWNKVEVSVKEKVTVLVLKTLKGKAPQYLMEDIEIYQARRALRSGATGEIRLVPKSENGKIGRGAWHIMAPHMWNLLPSNVRTTGTSVSQMKTFIKTVFMT
jgi:hypothetical protein